MEVSPFELLDQSTFKVGGRKVKCSYCNPPFQGKYKYLADGISNEKDSVWQQLFIHDFSDTHPTDLPNGISITIVDPKSDFREVNFAKIEKIDDKSELTIILNFNYVDWHLPISLPHFLEGYREALFKEVKDATQATIESSDVVGFFISCSVVVQPTENFWSAYLQTTSQMLTIYRKFLAEMFGERQQLKPKKTSSDDDNSGAKWWFRYVIVPVLGSGAVAAIAAGLMAFAK